MFERFEFNLDSLPSKSLWSQFRNIRCSPMDTLPKSYIPKCLEFLFAWHYVIVTHNILWHLCICWGRFPYSTLTQRTWVPRYSKSRRSIRPIWFGPPSKARKVRKASDRYVWIKVPPTLRLCTTIKARKVRKGTVPVRRPEPSRLLSSLRPPAPQLSAAAAADLRRLPEMDDSCAVCADTLEWVAYGPCGHREVCSTCVVRLRFVMDDKHCCICKTLCPSVLVTKVRSSGFCSLRLRPRRVPDLCCGCIGGSWNF
jgi:hypothetical protein